MANGYIGKISAIVTASTADLSRKLQGGTRDVNRFANSVQSQIAGAASSARRSFEGIFTPLQRIQRALDAGRGTLNIIDDAQVRRFQQAVSIAEQINKPLASASRAFQGLSADVAAGLLPALLRAQDAATRVNDEISTTGGVTASSYRVAEQAIDRAAAAFERFRQAEQIIGSAPRGRELQFQDPQLFSALQASAEARRGAAAPGVATRVGSALGDAVREVTRFDELVAQAAARISGIRLAPQVDTSQLERAQGEYQDLLVQQRRAVDELNRLSTDPAQVERDADDAAFAAFVRSQQESLKLENQLAAAADQRAAAEEEVFQAYIRQQQAAKQLDTFLADQDPAERVRRREQEEENARRRRDEELQAIAGRRTDLGGRLAEQGRRRVRGLTGDINIDATPPGSDGFSAQAQRDIDALGTRVGAVRQQLETLPNSIRTRFIPALQRARDELVRLQNSPAATVEAIERAAASVTRLERNARRAQAAFALPNAFEALEAISVRGFVGQLQAAQRVLLQVGATAGGPVAQAYDRLRAAQQRFIEQGIAGTPAAARALRPLQEELARAAAATGRISFSRAFREIQRGGDVARGTFGNVGLAVQQAAFAFDDFFSVTGDIDQRIRAAGNNISQLGFVIGGTWGLIGGIVLSVGAQAAAALINWYNEGIKASDSTKALNDALARQKSLVEDLAQAFKSLGDDLARRVFSAPAQEARAFAREIDEIVKKQRDLRESRVNDLDPGVQRERGRQAALQRELESESDAGRRVAIQRELRDSRAAEARAAAEAASRVVSGEEVAATILRQAERNIRRLGGAGETSGVSRRIADRANELIGSIDTGGSIEAIRSQRAAIEREIERLVPETNRGFFSRGTDSPNASQDIAELQQLLNSLELPLQRAIDELATAVIRSSQSASVSIEAAQEDVADAIRRGVRGAADFQAALDESARQLVEANAAIEAASQIENPEEREAAVRRAQDRVRDVRLRQDAINEAAREVRLGRTFGGERTTAALSALEGNERFVNEQARLTARVAAAVDAELQARRDLESAIASGDQAAQKLARKELEAAQAASDLAAAAAEAALSLEQAFARIRRTADNFLSASEGLADDAQRRLDELDPNAPGAPNRDELRRERDEAEQQLIRDTRRNRELQNRLDRERTEAANDPQVQLIDDRLEQLRSDRDAAAARARIDGVQEDPAVAQARADEEASLLAERDQIIRQSTAGTQALIDEENRLAAARRRAIEEIQRQREFEAEVARRRDPEGDAIRGLDLLDSPGERAATELRQTLADIDAAFARQQEAILDRVGGRPQDAQAELDELGRRRREAAERAQQDALRQAAPAIFGLADQVANAVLQGPSRAALNATDVSTVEGSRELNRLLRGDDAARDQNLVELQKQSQSLDELVRLAREGGAQVANN